MLELKLLSALLVFLRFSARMDCILVYSGFSLDLIVGSVDRVNEMVHSALGGLIALG